MKNKEKAKSGKRIISAVSVVVGLGFVIFVTWLFFVKFSSYSKNPEDFKRFIESYGYAGMFVALAIQMLQVVIALLPGEFIEIGLGYAYGAVTGTVICLVGTALASTLVFALTKKWGIKLVELFTDADKIDRLKFINSEKKLDMVIFILFLIPGTPKDLLTYFAGLTRITIGRFLAISMIARIPSVVSSTIGGSYIGNGKYIEAVVILAVTGIISFIGLKIYYMILGRKEIAKNEENKNES